MAKKLVLDFKVSENRRLNSEYVVLTVKTDEEIPSITAGQFAEIKVDGNADVFLRRPFSIQDVDYNNNSLKFLIQSVGKGTETLCNLSVGSTLNILFPLGNRGFSIAPKESRVLLIGGGCGIAPLMLLGKQLLAAGVKPEFLLGARDISALTQTEEYEAIGKTYYTTVDGSKGTKGFVIHHPVLWDESNQFDMIYTCGPDAMMKAVAKYAAKRNIECEASLENTMACGFGVCLCCVTESVKGHVCVCTEGPVFNIKDLKWQISE